MIRTVIADDHQLVRDGLRLLLEAQEDIDVVAEAGDIEMTARCVLGYKPDVLVLDLNMPDGTSITEIPKFLESSPETSVVMLTMQDDPVFVREALQAGALGYVLKHAAASELVQAIRAVSEGQSYISPRLGACLAAEGSDRSCQLADGLSEREIDVLRLIALGYTNKEIAEQLFISIRTVESHRSHIQQKLNLSTRAELVQYTLSNNLIST